MAGIVLKDRNGNAVEYSGANQIRVPHQDSEGNVSKKKLTRMSSLKAYVVIASDVISGGYKVTKKLSTFPTDDFFMSEFSVEDCEEFGYETSTGSHKLIVFLTPKSLTVGKSYAVTDMY